MIRCLTLADYRVMPWKNGLGTTTEIAVHPEGAGLDAFTWRVSIADLGASGPFSTFAGYDRILVQIEGPPMTLAHGAGDEKTEHRLQLLSPHRFAGEIATHGALEGPARDFNVMTRRDRASAEVTAHELAPGHMRSEKGAETFVLYVLRGAVTAAGGGQTHPLGAGEALLATGCEELSFTASAEGAAALAVRIGPTGALDPAQGKPSTVTG